MATHGLISSLFSRATKAALRSPVISGAARDDGIEIVVGDAAGTRLLAGIVINSAGLSAPTVARSIVGFPAALAPRAYLAKGSYFSLARKAPFSRLVYPVPEPGGLGVHLTLDLAGQARFGPDVQWVEEIDYRVEPARAERFYAAIRKYWPALRDGELQPAYAGIRPKIVGPGEADADFVVHGPADHGIHGLVNLFGIESPGLTSCLAIADAAGGSLGIGSAR